jgi:hypothetical protein
MDNTLMPLSFTRTLRLCKVPECNGKHKAHGLCFKHYQRLRKHGDPNYAITNAGKRAEAKTLGLKRYFTGDVTLRKPEVYHGPLGDGHE